MLICKIHSESAAWTEAGGGPALPAYGLRCSAQGLSTPLAAPGCVPQLLLTDLLTTASLEGQPTRAGTRAQRWTPHLEQSEKVLDKYALNAWMKLG